MGIGKEYVVGGGMRKRMMQILINICDEGQKEMHGQGICKARAITDAGREAHRHAYHLRWGGGGGGGEDG